MTQTPTPPARADGFRQDLVAGVSVAAAFAYGVVLLVNWLAGFRLADLGYDPNVWWINFRPLPRIVEQVLSLAAGVTLLAYAAAPAMALWRRRATRITVELLWVLAAWNVINYFGGAFTSRFPVPFALVVALCLVPVWIAAASPVVRRTPAAWAVAGVALLLLVIALPLLQIVCVGSMNHLPQVKPAAGGTYFVVFCDDADDARAVSEVQQACEALKGRGVARLWVVGHLSPDAVLRIRQTATDAGLPAASVNFRDAPFTSATVRDVATALPRLDSTLVPLADGRKLARVDMLFGQAGRVARPVPVSGNASLLAEIPQLWAAWLGALRQ